MFASGTSTVVENSPSYPKVEGSGPAGAVATGVEKTATLIRLNLIGRRRRDDHPLPHRDYLLQRDHGLQRRLPWGLHRRNL